MHPLKFSVLSILLILSASFVHAQDTKGHPALEMTRAKQLFEAGKKDEATYRYYVAQLRFRIHLLARPELKEDEDFAVFSSLSDVVGRPVNMWAFGDVEQLVKTIDRVINWHSKNDDVFTPKSKFKSAHGSSVAGLRKLRNEILQNADMIRAKRTENGLENR